VHDTILASGGDSLSATDAEILAAVKDIGREGLCVEPSSALPVACLRKLLAACCVQAADPVVCVLTAAGIRWPAQLAAGLLAPRSIDPAPELWTGTCRA